MLRKRIEIEDVRNGYRLNMYDDLDVTKDNYENLEDALQVIRSFMIPKNEVFNNDTIDTTLV